MADCCMVSVYLPFLFSDSHASDYLKAISQFADCFSGAQPRVMYMLWHPLSRPFTVVRDLYITHSLDETLMASYTWIPLI